MEAEAQPTAEQTLLELLANEDLLVVATMAIFSGVISIFYGDEEKINPVFVLKAIVSSCFVAVIAYVSLLSYAFNKAIALSVSALAGFIAAYILDLVLRIGKLIANEPETVIKFLLRRK